MKSGILTLAGSLLLASTLGASAASVQKSIDVKASGRQGLGDDRALLFDQGLASGHRPVHGSRRRPHADHQGDGKAQFVEKQTASDDKGMMYSYAIEKSPLPITSYVSTIKVVPKGDGMSTVEWSSTYTPDQGKEQDAETAIGGIYQAGLDNIQKQAGM